MSRILYVEEKIEKGAISGQGTSFIVVRKSLLKQSEYVGGLVWRMYMVRNQAEKSR